MRAALQLGSCIILLLALVATPTGAAVKDAFDKFESSSKYVHSKAFFEGGEDSLAWDSDDLNEVRKLHEQKFDDEQTYMQSFHLADYLGMHMAEAVHMPVPLNLIFIGFSGDGNMDLNITKEDLITWFHHLDHILPHTRISLAELSCLEDAGHCSAFMKAEAPQPLRSYVHLNLSCHVVDLDSRPILLNFERAIAAFSRPVDPAAETGPQQVDAVKMERFVDNFIKSLGFSEQYSILVLNPRWSPTRPKYGYRTGLSAQEVAFLTTSRVNDRVLAAKKHVSTLAEPQQKPLWSHSWDSPWTYPRSGAEKFRIHDAVWTGEHWAQSAAEYLDAEEKHRSAVLKLVGGETGSGAMAHAARVMAQGDEREGAALYSASVLMNPDAFRHHPGLPTSPPVEDCLVHCWVGHERWLLIDLTAGGFEWGPALGAEGGVHPRSMPSVNEFFQSIKEAKRAKAAEKTTEEHRQAAEQLEAAKSARLGSIANKHYHAFFRQHQEDLRSKPPGVRDAPGDTLQHKWERHHSELLIQAELDVLEEFALRHCAGKVDPPAACLEAKHKADELHHSLQALTSTTGTIPRLVKEHRWDIFGRDNEHDINVEALSETMRAQDLFMSRMASVLSRGIRHVIAPATAMWHHDGYIHDTATPYSSEVHFEFFVVSDTSRKFSRSTPSATPPQFDLEAFKQQVLALKLTHQQFSFVVRHLSMQDDPQLATSFSTSLRATYQQVPLSTDTMHEFEQVYLDSRELAHKLQQQFPTAPRRGSSRQHSQLHVPVFVFLLSRETPVLIDQHYNARALEDLVIVVANSAKKDEHPVGFTCESKLQSRPSSPLKDALAAMLQHLGGVLPPHLGYRPMTHTVHLDWLWSVGSHPFSFTSSGLRYTKLQKDALWRSYLLDALDTSIDRINQAILLLSKGPPQKGSFPLIKAHHAQLREVLELYSQVVHLWHSLVNHAQQLAFSQAVELIPALEQASSNFLTKCQEVHSSMHPLHCAAKGVARPFLGFLPPPVILGCSIVVLAAMIYTIYATHSITKPKTS